MLALCHFSSCVRYQSWRGRLLPRQDVFLIFAIALVLYHPGFLTLLQLAGIMRHLVAGTTVSLPLVAPVLSGPVVVRVVGLVVVTLPVAAESPFSAALEAQVSVRRILRGAVSAQTVAVVISVGPFATMAISFTVTLMTPVQDVHDFVSKLASIWSGFSAAEDESVWSVPIVLYSRLPAGYPK